jgi:CheY-like chemotaxis protein
MKSIDTVLVIEDEEIGRYLAVSVLKKMGIGNEILLATNGLEALKILREACRNKKCPDLILLDIKMPVMDGFEFLIELSIAPDININDSKIILLTSSASPRDVERSKLYPISSYIYKPLTKEKLQEILEA